MRRTLLISLLALVISLTAVTVAAASADRQFDDSDIEYIEGNGRIHATMRGALIGSVQGTGTVTVSDLADRVTTQVFVVNESASWKLDPNTTVYAGDNLRFRVFRGKWRVKVQGDGIFVSMVGTGAIGFAGEGRYSLAGAPYRPWPEEWTTLKLGADE